MLINTSRGHLLLLSSLTNLKFLRFQSVKNKRLSKRLSIYSDSLSHLIQSSLVALPLLPASVGSTIAGITVLGSA